MISHEVQGNALEKFLDENHPAVVSKRTKHLRHADPELPFAECGEQLELEHRALA